MKRSTRMEQAKQTVEIVERGSYESAGGRAIDIATTVRACLDSTRFFPPEELERLRQKVLTRPAERLVTTFEVVNARLQAKDTALSHCTWSTSDDIHLTGGIGEIMKHVLAIGLCLPGALVIGYFGCILAMFQGLTMMRGVRPPPSEFEMICWFFWGGIGGACLGSTPGLVLGYYQGMRWVRPFLGAAAGALLSFFLLIAGQVLADGLLPPGPLADSLVILGPLAAALVILGFIFGSWPFLSGFRRVQK